MKWVAVIFLQILLLCAIMFVIITYYPKHGTVRYDCTLAEISPDVPIKVKEKCRNEKKNL